MKGKKRRSKLICNIWPFILAALVFLFFLAAVKKPLFVEDYYSDGFYIYFATALSFFSRLLPFSLWDIFWFAAIFFFLFGIAQVIRKKMKLSKLLLITGQALALLYAYFYISWGFNYFRPDIEKRIGLELQSVDEKLFRTALDSVIVMVNRSYTTISYEDYNDLDQKIEESYSENSDLLDIKYPNGYRRPKKMIFSKLIASFGISGYFGPFFNEINLNRRILPMEYPFLLAHEKAHQFGVARESDANLVAFVVCTKSDDRRLNYSGYLALLLYFMEDAQYFSDYHSFLQKLDKHILDELRFRQQYYYGLQNEVMEHAHEKIYDTYLKTNQVASGIKNYNQVVELAVSWLVRDSKLSE